MREQYLDRFRSARSSALLQKLIDALFLSPSITFGAATKLLGITAPAAARNVRKLIAAGVLTEMGRRRPRVFVAHEILDFMGDTETNRTPREQPAAQTASAD